MKVKNRRGGRRNVGAQLNGSSVMKLIVVVLGSLLATHHYYRDPSPKSCFFFVHSLSDLGTRISMGQAISSTQFFLYGKRHFTK